MRGIRVCLLSLLLDCKGDAFYTSSSGVFSFRQVRRPTLRLADNTWGSDPDLQNDLQSSSSSSSKGMKGYYRRPSRAIEKGGGFYVPGLEGEKIRVVSASSILILFVINRLGVDTSTFNSANLQLIVTEFTGILITMILFLQGFLAVFGTGGGKSQKFEGDDSANKASYISVLQAQKTENSIAAIETIARTIIQTCGDIVYVSVANRGNENNEVIFEIGPVNCKSINRRYLQNVYSKYAQSASTDGGLLVEDLAVFNKSGGDEDFVLEGSGGLVGTVVDTRGLLWVLRTASGSSSPGLQSCAKWIEGIIACPF